MSADHSVKSYDEEFKRLDRLLLDMIGLTQEQCASAVRAVMDSDANLGAAVVARDVAANRMAQEIETLTLRMLALRQPVARDLRSILGCQRISVEVERIADYAANIAKRARYLDQDLPTTFFEEISTLAASIQSMLEAAREAFQQRNPAKAIEVWRSDDDADAVYVKLIAELRGHMSEDKNPANVTACTHLLFVAKGLERMGDHITNIAEHLYFLVTGNRLVEAVGEYFPGK
jgi:phosphate transport system protein